MMTSIYLGIKSKTFRESVENEWNGILRTSLTTVFFFFFLLVRQGSIYTERQRSRL